MYGKKVGPFTLGLHYRSVAVYYAHSSGNVSVIAPKRPNQEISKIPKGTIWLAAKEIKKLPKVSPYGYKVPRGPQTFVRLVTDDPRPENKGQLVTLDMEFSSWLSFATNVRVYGFAPVSPLEELAFIEDHLFLG